MRNLSVTWFFISIISTGLRTSTVVWHRGFWGRMPLLTPLQSAGNCTRDLSYEKTMPYPSHHGHSLMHCVILFVKEFGPWRNYAFFNRKLDDGVNDVLSWFGINLMVCFQDKPWGMFCNLAKVSHPAELEIGYFNLELAIELYWWRTKCLLRNKLLRKIALSSSHFPGFSMPT